METVSTTSTATQSLVTALGGGSGIDMAALARNLASASFAPRIDRLTAKSELLDNRISAASSLKSMLLGLATSLGERVRQGDLSPQPQVANAAIARATLSGTRQPSGTFALEVTALAKQQTLASPAYTSATSATGSGTLTLRFGTVAGAGFTEDVAHAAVPITIASGATLNDVAAAINAKRAGVTAYVANTADGAKLVLKGAEGAANGFVLDAAETLGEEGLASLAWTPAADPARLLNTASDAAFKVDGLAMTATSNRAVDAIPGVTLNLTATNVGAPSNVSFSDPVTAITGAMKDLTGALNEIAAELVKFTNSKSGDLAMDDSARGLRRTFGALAGTVIMPTAPEGAVRTLADLGLTTQRDGLFNLDGRRLAASLQADPAGAAAMFTNGLFGVYSTIDGIARKASATSDPASLTGSIAHYTSQKSKASAELSKLGEQQEGLRARFARNLSGADSRIASSRSTLSFLQNQIAAWNASKN